MADLSTLRQQVFDYVRLNLGDQMIEVELDSEHYNMALDRALRVYRQRTDNAHEESYGFLQLVADQQEYTLDSNILEVRQVFRRSIGTSDSGQATQFEPFEAAFVNTYLLQAGRLGGLATYEMFSGYQELAARMFGGYLNFYWNSATKKLTLVRQIEGDGESVLLWLYNQQPDVVLLENHMIQPWLERYTLGECMIMLGNARSLFSTIAGPGGGTTLNGDALLQQGQAIIEECLVSINQYETGNSALTFTIG